ncbi:hypothetical protein FACS1894211_09510 [Clostridia bacterium]|nr:hypothetical protein FACS1894211_09510 [Clostridia bacterium]
MDWLFGWFYDLMYILQKSICSCIDFIVEIFFKLSGLEPVIADGKETDLLSHFALSSGVKTAFLGVMLIGIILLCIFVIIAIIRSEYAEGNQRKTKGQILVKAGQSFVIFLIIPFMLMAGIMLTNVVVGAIHGAMTGSLTGGGKVLFGGQLLVTSGDGAFTGGASGRAEIERMFLNGQLDYNNLNVVKQYYDLSEMNFFVGIASGLVILVMFALAALRFVQRLFDIILLYIISPVSVSTIPADDGQRFKLWREMVVSKVLGAYGIILSMNLFFLIIPQITKINFFGNSFQNGLVTILFIIGGAFAVSKAQMVIAQLTGNNAGAQEAQQMLAGIHAGARFGRGVVRGGAAVVGQIIGGSDYRHNQRKGVSAGENINASIHSTRNQHVVNNNKTGKDGDKKNYTAGQTAAHIAGGVGRLATLPVGVMKDLLQGGAITAGKNIWPRVRNVATGRGVFNRADVVRKHAEKSAEKVTETTTEKTDAKTESGNTDGGGI